MVDDVSQVQSGKRLSSDRDVNGELRIVRCLDAVDVLTEEHIAYIPSDADAVDNVVLFYALVRNGVQAILCEEISRTDHGVLLANELDVPCLTDIDRSITSLENQQVSVHESSILEGEHTPSRSPDQTEDTRDLTEANIKINLGFPELVNRRPRLVDAVDGVGFMRLEFVMLDVLDNIHPRVYVNRYGRDSLVEEITDRIEPVLAAFGERPVWIRTDDFSVAQLRQMEGGVEYEEPEENPMLGWRGIARSIDDSQLLSIEFDALSALMDRGYDNIGVFPPMTRFPREYRTWSELADEAGLANLDYGIMIETPAAALTFEEFVQDIEFMVFGSNDLTQFTLAIDRSNKRLESKYDEKEPAVLKLMESVIELCNQHGIESSIGGQAAADTELVTKLLEYGISGVSINPDINTLRDISDHIASIE